MGHLICKSKEGDFNRAVSIAMQTRSHLQLLGYIEHPRIERMQMLNLNIFIVFENVD